MAGTLHLDLGLTLEGSHGSLGLAAFIVRNKGAYCPARAGRTDDLPGVAVPYGGFHLGPRHWATWAQLLDAIYVMAI